MISNALVVDLINSNGKEPANSQSQDNHLRRSKFDVLLVPSFIHVLVLVYISFAD